MTIENTGMTIENVGMTIENVENGRSRP